MSLFEVYVLQNNWGKYIFETCHSKSSGYEDY